MTDDRVPHPAREATVRLPGEGRPLEFVGITTVVKASSADTDGAWTLIESTASPHFAGFKPHRHRKLIEAFYVVEGALEVRLGDRIVQAPAGSFILIPSGVVHTYSNPAASPARYLLFISPGGFEQYLEELARLIQTEPVWPPADPSQLEALALKYDATPP